MVALSRAATPADLDKTPDDGQTYEIIDGVIVVSPAPSWKHQETVKRVLVDVHAWAEQTEAGDIEVAPLDVVLRDGQTFQPDIFFVRTVNPGKLLGNRFHGVPDVAIEVISPTSRSRDWLVKGMRYASAGVPEYWVIDPDLRTITVHELVDGIYEERPAENDGSVTSGVMGGVRIDPVALFDRVNASVRRRGGTD